MRLVLDTNILMKALIKKSATRALLLNPNHRFHLHEYALEETQKHLLLIRRKTALSEDEIKLALATLLTNLDITPSDMIAPYIVEARKIMHGIDEDDAPFVAAALSIPCDGIWSDDEHLKRQTRVRVWNTHELMSLLYGNQGKNPPMTTNWNKLQGMLKSRKSSVKLQHQAWSKGSKANMTEAVILNEKIRRPAPEGFNSQRVIKAWRRAH